MKPLESCQFVELSENELINVNGGDTGYDSIITLAFGSLNVAVAPPIQTLLGGLDQPLFTVWIDRGR